MKIGQGLHVGEEVEMEMQRIMKMRMEDMYCDRLVRLVYEEELTGKERQDCDWERCKECSA